MSLSTHNIELSFRQSVSKIPSERTAQDLTIIHSYLKHLETLSTLRESHIRNLCKIIRLENYVTHHILFSRGELNTCWYILLSGSVFIESTMYLPRASFGKRTPTNQYRINECVVLEPSELLVIDYPIETKESIMQVDNKQEEFHRKKSSRTRQRSITFTESNDISSSMILSSHSRASDTSSAYSGSDIMQSSTNGDDGLMINNDTDDESEDSEDQSLPPVRDHVREALMKDTNERTDDDIEVILEFLVHFPAFADLTLHVRRELCKVFVYAHVEKAHTIVMNDGERYDSWSVIINGIIDDETIDGQLIRTLTVGQSFGCGPTLDQYSHKGIMKTRVDDCQFIVVAQNDYYAILNQGEKSIRKIEENGKIIMIKEIRMDDDEHKIPREIVIKATIEKLLDLLVDENQLIDDPNFVEDFLLTYRTFLSDPLIITNKLLDSFHKNINSNSSEHIARVILSWVNNHYNDFESNNKLNEFLEKFDEYLQHHPTEHMKTWKYLLNLACFTKASIRTITITRSTRDDVLNFNILGGSDTSVNNGIFVSKVERNSKAYEAGLRRGDQILNVNGQCFDYLTHIRALEILRGTTHLSLTVKNNLMGLNEIVNPDKSPARKKRHDLSLYEQEIRNKLNGSSPIRSYSITPTTSPVLAHSSTSNQLLTTSITSEKSKPRPLTKRMGLKRAVMQKLKITKNSSELDTPGGDNGLDSSVLSTSNSNKSLNRSSSNPDLSISLISNKSISSSNGAIQDEDISTFVVKVYRSDQSFKYFPVLKDTTAQQVVMLAITEFNIGDQSRYYSLCEVSVENSVIKQKRLPDHVDNLPERLPINARYYLKNNNSTETLVPDHLSNELIREARIHFLHLDSLEICAQLTLRDFAIFKSIQPTEYIDYIFKIKSNYGLPHLEKFLRLPNQEMYWTITEIIREPNVTQRSKILKQFIKIAKCCKDMKNFNSMFAIISGLDHKTVQRLQTTWERVPDKYKNIFEELKLLLDLSRNMSVYRNLLKNEFIVPPIIPMFPVSMKDLTFIHLGNQTKDDHLINFEKLRMIAKEIRSIINMSSSPYDISNMFDSPTSHSQIFAGFGHQPTVDSHGTIRRNQTGMRLSIMANAKRIYDEALMVKRVKTYLSNADIIEDEDRLIELANQCEPISTIKRRPSPSTSSMSSNSSSDRRGDSVQLTKFGTQSPDAINKLFRLSDSSHQIKLRAPQKSNPNATLNLLRNASPLIPSTGLTSVRESNQHKVTKTRDTNKLTSESSSLNFKAPPSTFYIRSHIQLNKPNGDLETSTDTGYSSNSGGKSLTWTDNSTKSPDEESTVDYDDQEQVTAV